MSRVERPVTRKDGYLLSADAFLLSGAVFLALMGILEWVFSGPSVASQVASQVVLAGSLVVGVLLAWVLHGHRVHGSTWLGMLIGALVGAAVTIPAFLVVFTLGRFVPSPFPGEEGPWGAVVLLSASVIAFLALPTFQAVRDLGTRTGDLRVAWTRLGALVVILAAVMVTMLIGGETAEAGLFMVPLAAIAAVSVSGVQWFEGWRAQRHER